MKKIHAKTQPTQSYAKPALRTLAFFVSLRESEVDYLYELAAVS